MELVRGRRRRTRHRLPGLAALAAALGLGAGGSGAVHAEPAEYEVKAAFLYNFARFVQWPAPLGAEEPAFAVCLLAGPEIEASMAPVIHGRPIGSSRVEVRRIDAAEDAAPCRLIFVSEAARQRARGWLRALDQPVLVVGEGEGFARDPGMIGFVEAARKLRFDVNRRRAEAVGLRISSHLLKLAHEVVE